MDTDLPVKLRFWEMWRSTYLQQLNLTLFVQKRRL